MLKEEKHARIQCPNCKKSLGFIEMDEEELKDITRLMCMHCSELFFVDSNKAVLFLEK